MIFTNQPYDFSLALQGLDFINNALSIQSTLPSRHPIYEMFLKAEKDLSSGSLWGASREANLLSTWGIRLSMVQDWSGFEELMHRIKSDSDTWDAHLHEAITASMFWFVGCDGNF